jgi:diguanylate cyclase (GGDEF)-like protein/PAS domain S-box-containing protein
MDQKLQSAGQQQTIAGAYANEAAVFATSLLDNANDLFAVVDSDLRFVGLNAGFRREFELVFGSPVDLGQRLDEALAHLTGDRDKATALCRRALAGESFRVIEEFGDEQLLRKTYELAFSPIVIAQRQPWMAAVVVRDLTLQRLSEQRFGALLEAAPDAMIVVRADGVIDLANAHAERMFQYEKHKLNGLPVELLLPQRFRARHVAHRKQFSQQSTARPMGSGRVDLVGLRADGSEFPIEISLNSLEVGGEKMVVGAIRDMTVRQRAEQALRQQQESVRQEQEVIRQQKKVVQQLSERLTLALKAGRSGWFDLDLCQNQNHNHWSDELLALYGLARDEFGEQYQDWLDCLVAEDQEAGAAAMRDALETGDFVLEFRIRRRDTGDIRWMHGRAQVMFDDSGSPARIIGINVDITEQKQAEVQLRDSETRFRLLADHIAQFAWIADETGARLWFNQRWFEYTGTTLPQVQGWGWQQVHHPEHVARVVEKYRRCIDAGIVWEDTFPLRGRHGQYRWFLTRAIPIHDEAGGVQQWFGTSTDITEQRQAEQALRDSERRYMALFNNKTNAIAHLRIVTNEQGLPVDCIVEKINDAYTQVTGIKKENIEGRQLTEVFPGIEHAEFDFIGTYGKIAREGGETHVEVYFTYLKQWLSIYVYSPQPGECIAVFTDVTANKLAEAALRDSEAQLRATFEQAAVGIVHLSVPERRFLRVNQAFCRIVGYAPDELLALSVSDLTHPDDLKAYEQQYAALMSGQLASFTMEKRYIRKDRAVIWVRKTFSAVRDEHGAPVYGISVVEDITAAKQADLVRQEAENRLQLAVSIANLGFWEWDVAADQIYFSVLWKSQLGYQDHELPNGTREWQVRLHPDDRDQVVTRMAAYIAAPTNDFRLEYRLRHRDGSYHTMVANAIAVSTPAGQVVKLIGTQLDVTESKRAEQRVLEAARHDPLTGLPNRALVFEYASHMLAAVRRNPRRGAFLFIDLDRFKPINDLYGHGVGDRVLQEAATRLVSCVRDEDLVGRLGGDEFVIMLPQISGQRATTVARHVMDALSCPFQIDEQDLSISASIGISHFPEHGLDVDALIHAADLAMYQAKQGGRANYHVYTSALSDRADAASLIEAQLKRALKHGGLALHYQPVVDIRSRRVIGAEALLRLAGDDGREIGPDRFIPIAEAAGLITELGEWAAIEACRQHQQWRQQGLPPFTIAINVSPLQFRQRAFVQRLQSILHDAQMDPACFQIEVTESAVMDSVDEAIDTLNQIKSIGIRIALDDFGTGYSSLSHLSRLPLDKLKVDQSFVRRLEQDRTSRAITGAIIALGRTLNLEVVGEGIESKSDLDYLQENGCDQGQGFYLSHPLPANLFANWFQAESSSRSLR